MQPADARTEQPQRAMHEFLPRQQSAAEPVDIPRLVQRFLHGQLPREGREIAVAHLHLHRERREPVLRQFAREILCLFPQTGPQRWPVTEADGNLPPEVK